MSEKTAIKRMARHLMERGVPPDAPGVAQVLERMRVRPRTLVRAMYRRDQKRLALDPSARPRLRQSPRGMGFNVKTGRWQNYPGWRAITW